MLKMVLPLIAIPFCAAGVINFMIASKAYHGFIKWHLNQKELDILFLSETPIYRNYVRIWRASRNKMPMMKDLGGMMGMGPMGMSEKPLDRMKQFLLNFYEGRNKPFRFYQAIRFIGDNGIEVAVVKDGRILENLKDQSEKPIFKTASQMSRGEIHSVRSNGLITYATPVYVDFNNDGNYSRAEFLGVVSTTFTSSIREIKKVAGQIAIFATFMMLLAICLTGFLIAKKVKWVTKPIGELVRATRNLAEGKEPELIKYRGDDEVGVLAKNFDEMVKRLRVRTEERDRTAEKLEDLNKNLEQIVEMRTQELAQANEALTAASEHKSQFLANMSHELRTPMNAILGFTELLKDGIYGDLSSKTMEIIDKIQKNGQHLLDMINDVLDLTKIEAGRIEIRKASFSVRSCIETVIANTTALANQKGLKVIPDIPEDLPTAYGDEKRVNQILWNLLSNAIKFTEKGDIGIGARAEDKALHFWVSDTGIGIPTEKLGRIFEEFTQVDSSHTRQYGGTGLGLSIAKRLVELHGGRIWVESEVEKGSVFHFTLSHKSGEDEGSSKQEKSQERNTNP
jgi:signal transduction histidine kinase